LLAGPAFRASPGRSPHKGQNILSIITGTGGVIGTIVGAYFGLKLGSAGAKEATRRAIEMAAIADPQAAQTQLREGPRASATTPA
jgi:hydroxyethylthiazole kinase-like sugar kinase family protein